tara:strand:- start:53941 stop:56598 length:2658 start_codon:yes stop_codon:yes gene_type:complete
MMVSEEAKSIFLDMLAIPLAEQAEHLDRVCSGNPALKERVESLLKAHLDSEGFLGETAASITMRTGQAVEMDDEVQIPTMIGMYEVVRVLGRGGFGTVYLCTQREPIERLLAVKVLHAGMDTRLVLRRFEEERILLAKMDHPGIARVLDAGKTEAGQPYIGMEYVEGEMITAYCNSRRLDLRARLSLFSQACQAVGHAHQKMVIHRDVKPSNVLVTEVDGKPIVKVIDFGISKAMDASEEEFGEREPLTRTMQLVGTPQYMSPEQASTEKTDFDTRSDVYSLGVMLYELTTGVLPFDAKRLRSASAEQLEQMIRDTDPQRPSTRVAKLDRSMAGSVATQRAATISTISRQLKGEIDWIITKAMEKKRDRRYSSVAELGADIERYLNGRAVQARPPSSAYTLRKLIARNKAWSIAALLVVSSLIVLTTMSVVSAKRIRSANTQMTSAMATQEQVLRFTEEMLRGIDPAVARGQDTTLFREILDSASERINSEITESPEVEVRVRILVGELYRTIGLYDEAIEHFRPAAAIALEAFGARHIRTIEARSSLGIAYVELSDYDRALTVLELVYQDVRETMGEDHLDTLVVLSNLSTVYGYLENREMAIQAGERLLASRVRVLGDDHNDTMATRNNLAMSLKAMGEYDRSKSMLERVLAHQLEHLGENHPITLKTRTNIAQVYHELKLYDQAVAMNKAVLEQKRSVLGETHPSVLVSMVNLGVAYEKAGDQSLAQEHLSNALQISIDTLGEQHQYSLIIKNNLASYYARNEEFEKAVVLAQASLDGLKANLDNDHPMVIQSKVNLADMLISMERYSDSLALIIELQEQAVELYEDNDPRYGKLHELLGFAHGGVGNTVESLEHLRAATELYRSLHGEDSEQFLRVMQAIE